MILLKALAEAKQFMTAWIRETLTWISGAKLMLNFLFKWCNKLGKFQTNFKLNNEDLMEVQTWNYATYILLWRMRFLTTWSKSSHVVDLLRSVEALIRLHPRWPWEQDFEIWFVLQDEFFSSDADWQLPLPSYKLSGARRHHWGITVFQTSGFSLAVDLFASTWFTPRNLSRSAQS